MDKNKIDFKRVVFIVLLAVFFNWMINNFSVVGTFLETIVGILSPFILGGVLAFIFNIPMTFFEKKIFKVDNKNKKSKNKKDEKIKVNKGVRGLSLILAIATICIIISLIITLIVPELVNVVNILIENIPYYVSELGNVLKTHSSEIDFEKLTKDLNVNLGEIKNQLLNKIPILLSSSVSLISGIFGGITTFIIAIVFSIYILTDKENIGEALRQTLYAYMKKENVEKILNVGNVSSNTFKNFFTVQCLESIILGSLCIIGMCILKIPYAVPVGVLVGVTALIPVVGAFIGCIIGAILIVAVNPLKVVTFIVFFLILQQIEGNVIYPKVVGNSIGLPGMLVLVAVSVGGELGGIIGMLIGVPVLTVIYTLIKKDVTNKNENSKVKEIKEVEAK